MGLKIIQRMLTTIEELPNTFPMGTRLGLTKKLGVRIALEFHTTVVTLKFAKITILLLQ